MNYRLDYAEPHIVKETQLSNSTHQSYRWVTIAVSEDLGALKEFYEEHKKKFNQTDYRIEDSRNGEIVLKDYINFRSI
ncbi:MULTISPECIES: hypothetical protein [Bacillus]|uniref:Uncharacterized protein n=1 Tax=Bacillus glycinifermentans TaxID=1664069 RepID=A0A0T6BI49_9BACI|nr:MULTISPECIES: hypothetical protein [Bacillus]KRT87097.1 hypothetical protein AB447_209015 [Bacillus glycinifermentans]MEC0342578.1 hypothetical protein [Bacillus sonorensis]MEC0457461.1 hypothetical protein [Bacillus sonorensis]MEC0487144.1 hypothetical protein [Bacillus glycinifermentans]MEC0530744.1 hypothetical protein [Bacillus sonorensis]